MTADALVRVLINDPDDNVAFLTVACPQHAQRLVHNAPRGHRFHLSPLRDSTRPCDHCIADHSRGRVTDWPLELAPGDDEA